MATHSLMVFFHIMLLVFWLGTDLGVFLAAKRSERSDLSAETRANLMQLGMVLDRLPRTALILMLPSGFTMANNMGMVTLSASAMSLIWVASLLWAVIMWAGFLKPETSIEKMSHHINFVLHLLLVVVLGYVIFRLWDSVPFWLSMKMLAVTLILICGVGIDITFKPAVAAFKDIMTNGATPERDALYRKAIAPVYWWVIGIYILVTAAAYFGVVKPM